MKQKFLFFSLVILFTVGCSKQGAVSTLPPNPAPTPAQPLVESSKPVPPPVQSAQRLNLEIAVSIQPIEHRFTDFTLLSVKRIGQKDLMWGYCIFNEQWIFNPHDGHCGRYFAALAKVAKPLLSADSSKELEQQFYSYNGSPQT